MSRAMVSVGQAMLSICLLFSFFKLSLAQQTVAASNQPNDLPQPGTARYFLNASNVGINGLKLVPLSHALEFLDESQFEHINITGTLREVGDDPSVIKSGDIAYISCDASAYPGHLTADSTVLSAVQNQATPRGIILYSVDANHCNYSVPQNVQYDAIFTTLDPVLAQTVLARLQNSTDLQDGGSILPVPNSLQNNSTSSSGNSSNGSSNSSNNVLGPSPTTAVAMIILYSITGIITALFLVIIVTGAIRAHRHPERYGPRNTLGRPRQSRAKGLARAMLETLPIVKFGDQEETRTKPNTGDSVELGMTGETGEGGKRPSTEVTGEHTEGENLESPIAGATHSNDSHYDTAISCSICTEDFAKGQDIRVLPCNHKFHPDCVDPWLLNVSGTCPLCRVDLRPTPSNTAEEGAEGTDPTEADPAPPLEETPVTDAPSPAARQRNSFFYNLRHLRDAPAEERLAALRTLHSANQQAGPTADTERERRLSTRLRETFRIRTRRQGNDTALAPETDIEAAQLERRRTGTLSR